MSDGEPSQRSAWQRLTDHFLHAGLEVCEFLRTHPLGDLAVGLGDALAIHGSLRARPR